MGPTHRSTRRRWSLRAVATHLAILPALVVPRDHAHRHPGHIAEALAAQAAAVGGAQRVRLVPVALAETGPPTQAAVVVAELGIQAAVPPEATRPVGQGGLVGQVVAALPAVLVASLHLRLLMALRDRMARPGTVVVAVVVVDGVSTRTAVLVVSETISAITPRAPAVAVAGHTASTAGVAAEARGGCTAAVAVQTATAVVAGGMAPTA